MSKQEFLNKLNEKLKGLPREDVSERVEFYSEMIDDRMEEGLAEEEAVLAIGSVDEIAEQIKGELSHNKTEKKKIKNGRKMKAWEIVLLSVGSPIWLALLIVAFSIAVSLYAVIWAVVVSLWAAFGALVGCAFGSAVGGILIIVFSNPLSGIALIGGAFACAGLSIFMFFGCLETTKGVLKVTKWIFVSIRKKFARGWGR